MLTLLRTDVDIEKLYNEWAADYIHGIYIHKVRPLNINAPKYDPKTSKKRESSKISTKFNYISTELDLTKDTLKEAIQKKHYIKNECLFNTFYDCL